MNYDSILTAIDSSVIHRTEFYKEGVTLPDSTVPMDERVYAVCEDGYVVAAMMLAGLMSACSMLLPCRQARALNNCSRMGVNHSSLMAIGEGADSLMVVPSIQGRV